MFHFPRILQRQRATRGPSGVATTTGGTGSAGTTTGDAKGAAAGTIIIAIMMTTTTGGGGLGGAGGTTTTTIATTTATTGGDTDGDAIEGTIRPRGGVGTIRHHPVIRHRRGAILARTATADAAKLLVKIIDIAYYYYLIRIFHFFGYYNNS